MLCHSTTSLCTHFIYVNALCFHLASYRLRQTRSFIQYIIHAFISFLHCVPFHAKHSFIHSSSPPSNHPSIQFVLAFHSCIQCFAVAHRFKCVHFVHSFVQPVHSDPSIHEPIHPFVDSFIHLAQSFIHSLVFDPSIQLIPFVPLPPCIH